MIEPAVPAVPAVISSSGALMLTNAPRPPLAAAVSTLPCRSRRLLSAGVTAGCGVIDNVKVPASAGSETGPLPASVAAAPK